MDRAILKINTSGKIEVFTSLEPMFIKYEHLRAKKSSMVNYLTRKKQDYVADDFTLRRVFVNEP